MPEDSGGDARLHRDANDLEPSDLELIAAASDCRGFESKIDLEHAVRHTRQPRFGQTKNYYTPLSRQFKDSIKRLFPVDRDLFIEADRVQRLVYVLVFAMRMISVTMYLAFLAQVVAAFDCTYNSSSQEYCKSLLVAPALGFFESLAGQAIGLLSFILMWGAIWSLIRTCILRRAILIFGVSNFVKLFAAHARTRYDAIDSKITEATANSEVIGNPEPDGTYKWPLRAKLETIIALWNAKRAEYLDRYSTIVFWKIRWYVTAAERVAVSTKLILSIGALGFIWLRFGGFGEESLWTGLAQFASQSSARAPAMVLFGASVLVAATGAIGFFRLGRLRNDHWTLVLIQEVQDLMLGEKHYFHRFGSVAEDFARRVMGPTRLQETGAPIPENRDD